MKPKNVATIEAIYKLIDEVQSYLEAHYETDNIAACIDRLRYLEGYLATTGKALADSKYYLRETTEASVMLAKAKYAELSPSTLNKFIESICRENAYLVDRLDRLNSGCTHQLDATRTVISTLKEELKITNYFQGKGA
jgi:hypothetical protein